MRTIGGLFGRSAWGPLWEHLEKARECINLLKSSVDHFISGHSDKLEELARKVTKFEKEADIIKENIRQRLSRSIFSSIERSEIMAWLRQQDGIADSCEDMVKLFSLRKTKVVKELVAPLKKLAGRVIQMADELVNAVKIFGGLDITEAGRQEINDLTRLIDDTQKGKDDVDRLQLEFLKTLFKVEKKMDPVSIFFLINGTDKIARVADRIENVGDIIRHMLIK